MPGEQEVVLFSNLRVADRLVLETGRSTYKFTIMNLEDRRGMLVGGNVNSAREAIFSGSLKPTKELWEEGIQIGSRATFFLVVPHDASGFSQVITSPLTKIRLIRGTLSLGSERG